MNPVKAGIVKNATDYQYSSCEQYMSNNGISKSKILYDTLGIDDYSEIFKFISDNKYFIDIDINEDEKIEFLVQEYQKEKKVSIDNIADDECLIKDVIEFLHNQNNIKYTDIIKVLKIPKTKLFKIKRSN